MQQILTSNRLVYETFLSLSLSLSLSLRTMCLCLHQIICHVVDDLHRAIWRQWKYEKVLNLCACASCDSSTAIFHSYLQFWFAMVAFKSRRCCYIVQWDWCLMLHPGTQSDKSAQNTVDIAIWCMVHSASLNQTKVHKQQWIQGKPSNTTLRILSVRGVPPPPFTDKNFCKEGVMD